MKILFISNIPTPYRNDFYNELGKKVDLTVIFEAKGARNQGIHFNWNESHIKSYNAIFLNDGDIDEEHVNPQIFKYLKKDYDYVFVTNYSYRTEMAAIIYLKCFRIPYAMEIDGGVRKKENILKRMFKTFLISGAQNYFSPSQETDLYLMQYGIEKRKIIRTPFSSIKKSQILKAPIEQNSKDDLRKRLGIVEKKVILGVGQLVHRKGWDILLKIASDVEAGIYIIGDGELRKEYERIIGDFKLENVHLVGFMSNEMTTQYYRAADIFVLPTRYDVWGLVVNEALANGLPVITTTECIAGCELITEGENGYIIHPDNSVMLLDRINKAFSENYSRKKMSYDALKSIRKNTIENMVDVHLKYFNIL